MRIHSSLSATLLILLFNPAAFADEPTMLKGKVMTSENHPVPGAKIVIQDEQGGAETRGESDGQGKFAIKHSECTYFSFDVIPPRNSSWSRARFEHVSGEAGKHFIVQLQRGFSVTGRVTAGGVGLKGVTVKALPNDATMSNVEVVHGGGIARTGKNGEYHLILTPGQKLIEVTNDKYSDLPPSAQQKVAVSGDTKLPDIVFPVVR